MVTTKQKNTASEIVLLAAADLTSAGNQEFSEWDLTVAAWALDRLRFGLRGYAQSHPDHKRVMMEIMGKKASSPVQQKYLEKTRPNYYRLTPLGKAIAAGLRSVELRPNDQLAWSSLSLFYVRAGMIPEAESAGGKARILGWGGKIKKPTA
jgi:hypothetical protein